ncbi:glutathione S-transferase T3-like [Tripterygium wilfordii]|uniref:glutathione S-transferase T3-like n=1 Tax=Tripterygium wilfordii TaxID=458696 RepID=UPI0018F84BB4|nr:glutathione S-transferase T3-like [Tripterygium wilfordii]
MDAVQGTNQKSKTFWARITATYNETRGPNHNERTERSLNSRWKAIQLAVNKFMGSLTQVEAARPSGTNEIDKIQMAKEMYQQLHKSHFQFDHCWNMLRHQPKWTMQMGQPSSKRKQSASCSISTSDAINLDEDDISISTSINLERPIGRKAEKERRKKGKGDLNELSDVIGQLTINKKKEHDERWHWLKLTELELRKNGKIICLYKMRSFKWRK